MPEDMKEAWRKLGRAVAVFLELRKRKALSATSPRLALHKTTVEQAHQTLRQVIQTLTPDDYLKAAGVSKSSYRTTLCSRMRDAFLSHGGPPPQQFPEEAVYYATAMILSQFKVEAGSNIDTIVRRLRKRIERNKLSPSC